MLVRYLLLVFLSVQLSSQRCYQNIECITCRDATRCQTPNIRYFVSLEGIIRLLWNNCIRGENSHHSFNCLQCPQGYSPQGNSCVYCTGTNCKTCNISKQSQCLSCPMGHYLQNEGCQACNISNCYQCSAFDTCSPCSQINIEKYYNDSSQGCVLGNLNLSCKYYSDFNTCSECYFGYQLSTNGDCLSPCPTNCKICTQASGCSKCYQGYGLNSSQVCVKCPTNCAICNISTTCLFCVAGKGISSSGCVPCLDNNCVQCLQPNVCLRCKSSMGVNSNGSCEPCVSPHCVNCYYNSSYCYSCGTSARRYFSINGTCPQKCYFDYCINCDQDYFKCDKCQENKRKGLYDYGDGRIICTTCSDYYCVNCSAQFRQCSQCNQGRGVQDNYCSKCQETNCLNCSFNYRFCTLCANGSYVENGTCLVCPTGCARCNGTYCFECGNSIKNKTSQNGTCSCFYEGCTVCDSGYFICDQCDSTNPILGLNFNQGGGDVSCVQCQQQNCTKCKANFKKCQECTGRQGPNKNQICSFCTQDSCLECPYYNSQCFTCADGYYQQDYICSLCPRQCETCYFNITVHCINCSQQFIMDNNVCQDLCGDSVVIELDCDNNLWVDFDGCDDQCEEMTNFTCQSVNQSSICSYTEPIQLEFVSFSDTETMNDYVLTLKVWPPLHIFSLASDSQILNSFQILNSQFSLTSVHYDPKTQCFSFTLKLLSKITSSSLEIKFVPSNNALPEYFATPEVTSSNEIDFSTIPYYSPTILALMNVLKYLCWIVVICCWISVLMGIITRNPFGLEAMFVVQFVWLTFLWTSSPFVFVFSSFVPLKYSTGYNFQFISYGETQKSTKPPYISQFGLSNSFFVNNFNFSFFSIILFTFLSLFLFLYLKLSNRTFEMKQMEDSVIQMKGENTVLKSKETQRETNETNEKNQNQEEAKVHKITKKYELALQTLLSFCLLSLMNFVNCSAIFFTSNNITNTPSLITFSISLSLVLLVIAKFFFEPDPFSYFRYSFRLSCLSLNHYYVHIFVLVSSTLLLIFFPSMAYLPLILLALMIIFTLKERPYLHLKNNLRSVFNYFVMSLFVIFKVYSQSIPKVQLTQNLCISILFILTFLLLVVAVLSIIFQIMIIVEQLQKKKDSFILMNEQERANFEILNNLVKTDVNQKMTNINPHNFFKQCVSPKKSLLALSNELKQKRKLAVANKNGQQPFENRMKHDNPYNFEKIEWHQNTISQAAQKEELKNQKQDKAIDLKEQTMDPKKRKEKEKAIRQIVEQQNTYINYKGTQKHSKEVSLNEAYLHLYSEI